MYNDAVITKVTQQGMAEIRGYATTTVEVKVRVSATSRPRPSATGKEDRAQPIFFPVACGGGEALHWGRRPGPRQPFSANVDLLHILRAPRALKMFRSLFGHSLITLVFTETSVMILTGDVSPLSPAVAALGMSPHFLPPWRARSKVCFR